MDLGFRRQGFVPILALDSEHAAINTYNFNDKRGIAKCVDLSKLSDSDLVTLVRNASSEIRPRGVIGGAPCQSFSSSNVHTKANDPRKRLLQRYASIVGALNKEFSLDFFVFENVVGLKSTKHRRYFRKIVRAFERSGFTVFEGELNASAFGVAQDRRRLFLVGINSRLFPNLSFVFPRGDDAKRVTVREVIGDLPEPTYFRRGLKLKDIPYHANHWTMNPRSNKFDKCVNGSRKGRSFRLLRWDQPSWTVAYGNREMHVHPNGTRRVSIFEAMRLQGFPKGYRLVGTLTAQVKQVSDAVPPPLAAAIARALRQTIYGRIENIQKGLLDWFEENQRSFPWRQTTQPYLILIAEKLLQQTAVTQDVVRAYNEITRLYPNVNALAKAPISRLRTIIGPLGLYYRARELTVLAREVIKRHGGSVPRDLKELCGLPGVGEYSARAVLSFAYGKRVGVVDTNIARLLHRLYGLPKPLPSNPARNKQLTDIADSLIPTDRSKQFNLAALDLCSSICTPRQPACSRCPISRYCNHGQRIAIGR